MGRYFRRIRQIVSVVFLTGIGFSFLDIYNLIPPEIIGKILYFQFMPAVIKGAFKGTVLSAVVIVVVLTLVFGRLYCSFLCPLGAFMDLVTVIKPGKNRYKPVISRKWGTRIGFGLIPTFFFIAALVAVDMLDPFSIFGRMMTVLVRPTVVMANNALSGLLERVGVYGLAPMDIRFPAYFVTMVVLLYLVVILVMTLKKGRLYCNTICPVGTFLRLVSRLSICRVRIDPFSCTGCGKCEGMCKAGCIDARHHHVDASMCVGCFDCMACCPEKSVSYRFVRFPWSPPPRRIDARRRRLTHLLVLTVIGFPRKLMAGMATPVVYVKNRIPVHRKHVVTPPGSQSIERFTQSCTACYLCVSKCPGQVIQPAVRPLGTNGLLLPGLNTLKGFCNYTCTTCGEVCPSGAIAMLTPEEKQRVQVGQAHFIRENCIVVTQKTACGACAEHCPTKAVSLTLENGLMIPVVDTATCVGCGACEYACPSLPHKSIYVEGHPVHVKAKPPRLQDTAIPHSTTDFPF